MKRVLFGLAVIGVVISIGACASTGDTRSNRIGTGGSPVQVVKDPPPVAEAKKVRAAPGEIQVLDPTSFNGKKDILPEVFSAIVGNKDTEIFPKDVRVVLPGGTTFTETIADKTDVSSWITNLPAGLIGQLHEAVGGEKGAKEFRILVSGTPTETRKEPVKVTIPGKFLTSGADTVVTPNDNALIDIAEALITVGEATITEDAPVAWARNGNTIIISGSVGSPIVPKSITVQLDHASIPLPISAGTNLSRWITNLPTGLQALASAAEKDAVEVVLTISGIPLVAIDQPIFVRIAADDLHRALDLVVKPNEDLRFEIFGLTISSVIIGGAINNEIVPKTFGIDFGAGRLLVEIPKDQDLSKWISNLPAGLKVVAAETSPVDSSSVSVKVSGVPTVYADYPIQITVPKDIIYEAKSFDVARNDYARFDVGSFDILTEQRRLEDSLNKNWTGNLNWQLNGPKLVDVKDFDAQGIVQITAQSVEEIGADGNYHWDGNGITYGKLLAEAKKIGAHAVINIVIDYEDEITEKIERRHVVSGYTLSAEEVALNKRDKDRLAVERLSDGTTILIEKTHRTVRTYTGTALAIKYAPSEVSTPAK